MNLLRDALNTKDGYQEIIDESQQFIKELKEDIYLREQDEANDIQQFPKPNKEIVKSTLITLTGCYFNLLQAEYSSGKEPCEIKAIYCELLDSMEKCWSLIPLTDFSHGFNEAPYYSTDNYWQIISLISLGVILEVNDNDFDRIVKIRDKVNTPDILLDFLIGFRSKREKTTNQLKYNRYSKLIEIIDLIDKKIASKALKEYLAKDWLKEYMKMGWSKTHDHKFNAHVGYWSFESGALAKALGFDISDFNSQAHFPFDLVNFQHETS